MADISFWERSKIAYAAFRRLGGIELPDMGRSSAESIGAAMSAFTASFSSLSPIIDPEMLKTLKCFSLYNPDFSQYIANIVNLGNPGHQLSVDARSDAVAEVAIERLNESASRVYQQGVGVDGLINQYLTSVAWSGAISSEDVINFAARRVEKVVLVPVEQIRFRYNKDLDTYEPYQQLATFARTKDLKTSFGLIPLNQETYKYYALSTVENSPYAKPPATAAVDAILKGQVPIMENIQFMAQKIGLMGLVAASVVPPPRKSGETEFDYQNRATAYLKSVRDRLSNFSKGLLVTFRDQKIEHTPVTTGAAGVYDLNRMSEEQIMSGLAQPPAFFGRTDSTTETFADVVYSLLIAQVANMQRVVKRRQEQTYRLDLRLGGIEVDSVSLAFDKTHSRNELAEAQANDQRFRTVLDKVKAGLIAPDQGAQELGEDSWFDQEMLVGSPLIQPQSLSRSFTRDKQTRVTLVFDRASQSYRHRPETIEVWSGEENDTADNVVPMIKKKALRASN